MIKKRADKCAIVGCYNTMADAPWGDKDFDIWILNRAIRDYAESGIAAWFDLHDWDGANYQPLYLGYVPDEPDFDIVSIDEYPYREIQDKYGYLWENSIPMMAAYAGLLDYKSIYMDGIEDGEFIDNPQMGFSLYHIIGALRQEGRKVYLCNYSRLDAGGLYGYKDMQKTRIPRGFYFK